MSSADPQEPKAKARLLCVDDDLCFLFCLTAVLEAAGYCVVGTSDPRKAVDLAKGIHFDLAILDYDMPHMNGGELASRLKQEKSDLPVILFSGSCSVPATALEAVDAHLPKGEDVDHLLRTVSANVA